MSRERGGGARTKFWSKWVGERGCGGEWSRVWGGGEAREQGAASGYGTGGSRSRGVEEQRGRRVRRAGVWRVCGGAGRGARSVREGRV